VLAVAEPPGSRPAYTPIGQTGTTSKVRPVSAARCHTTQPAAIPRALTAPRLSDSGSSNRLYLSSAALRGPVALGAFDARRTAHSVASGSEFVVEAIHTLAARSRSGPRGTDGVASRSRRLRLFEFRASITPGASLPVDGTDLKDVEPDCAGHDLLAGRRSDNRLEWNSEDVMLGESSSTLTKQNSFIAGKTATVPGIWSNTQQPGERSDTILDSGNEEQELGAITNNVVR
jgi:hypothetical protein